jgi:SEC-C motif-containing protein
MKTPSHHAQKCPCSSQKSYQDCCQPFHLSQSIEQFAPHVSVLMRSRYSAFVLGGLGQYLLDTWHSSQRHLYSLADLQTPQNYIQLQIINHQEDGDLGEVEFKASYIDQNFVKILHEKSAFVRENGRWVYVNGQIFKTIPKKIDSKDACPCGRGQRFKQCHYQLS